MYTHDWFWYGASYPIPIEPWRQTVLVIYLHTAKILTVLSQNKCVCFIVYGSVFVVVKQ